MLQVEHIAYNDNGSEQLNIQYDASWWRRLLGKQGKFVSFIYLNGEWVYKNSRKHLSHNDWFLAVQAEVELQRLSESSSYKKGQSCKDFNFRQTL